MYGFSAKSYTDSIAPLGFRVKLRTRIAALDARHFKARHLQTGRIKVGTGCHRYCGRVENEGAHKFHGAVSRPHLHQADSDGVDALPVYVNFVTIDLD